LTAKIQVSVEMVDKCIDCKLMKKGKAAGIDGLSVERLIMYSHPALVSTFCSDYARFSNEMHAMMTQF